MEVVAILSQRNFLWKTTELCLTEGIKEKQSTCGITESPLTKASEDFISLAALSVLWVNNCLLLISKECFKLL